ncbi:hypothetical protein ALC57_13895 [Trachymyrmex cornetzi]|uniref:Uncharacterized protein n=1 Tax=Trachymyrmex cornetzi TaxID=471704 RepID=A0A195DLV1_9HYME|nr:hypothetical protein ALC57_13895 [Trachymyrmex cornetzi]
MASEVRRFTCLTCSDFSKERAASEDSRREKTLNSKRIRRSPNEAGAAQVRGQTSLANRKFPDGSCVYSSRDNASPGCFNKGTQPHVTAEVRVYSLRKLEYHRAVDRPFHPGQARPGQDEDVTGVSSSRLLPCHDTVFEAYTDGRNLLSRPSLCLSRSCVSYYPPLLVLSVPLRLADERRRQTPFSSVERGETLSNDGARLAACLSGAGEPAPTRPTNAHE